MVAIHRQKINRFILILFLGLGLVGGFGAVAQADDHDCPNHPESTYTLQGDPDADKSQLEGMADAAKKRGAVCIMAFYDGKGPSNGKMLAFRRANWAMEQLAKSGVPESMISRVLRAADKDSSRKVLVVLGP